jgi:hypothetical protein
MISLNGVDGKVTAGFSSDCTSTSIFVPGLDLPTEKMPLSVKFYKSYNECTSDAVPHVSYNLENGIAGNYSLSFDKFTKEFNVSNYQLYLPSAHTRRMKSPFLNMIPRIMCGTFGSFSDCAPEPFQSISARVPWDYPLKNQLLMKDVTSQNCNSLQSDSKLFAIEDCVVRNRNMYGTLRRNELTCKPTAFLGAGAVVDLFERNDKFFMLYRSGADTKVGVYSNTGKIDQAFTVSSDHSFISFAAADNGDIYAMAPTQIFKFQKDTSGNYVQTDVQLISNGSLIEVTPDGNYLFLAKNSVNTFEVYHTSNFTLKSSNVYTEPVNQLQFHKGILYSGHDTFNAGNPAGIIFRYNFNSTTGVLTLNPANIGFENDINRFYITDNDHYYILHNSGVSYEFSLNPTNGDVAIIHGGGGGATMTNATSYVATRNVHYYSDGSNFQAYNVNTGGVWSPEGDYDGECGEDVALADGTNTQMISIQSYFAIPSMYNNFHLFEAGMKFSGLRTPITSDANIYLFPHLNEEQTKSTIGGGLNRIQRLLGPHGIGGMFHDFVSCTDLMAVLNVGDIHRDVSVDDPYTGFRTYNIHAFAANSSLAPYFCNDSDPDGACNNDVTLRFKVVSTGLYEKENYSLRLKCDNKVGGLEYLKYDSDETRREVLFWNTNDISAARYETVKMHKLNGLFKADVIKATKLGADDLWGRNISIEKSSDLINSKAVEYQRDNTNHMATFLQVLDSPAQYTSNADYISDGANNDFGGNANLCMSNANTNMSSINIAGCPIINQEKSTSFGMSLSIDELTNSDNPAGAFQSLFSIQP